MTTNRLTDEKIKIRINAIEDRRSASRDFWDGDYEYPEDIELLALRELQERRKADSEREQVRSAHAEWSLATFGDVGPVGPLKHLSKEALEAAAEPGDLSEWADMQFLLWDAQRRAGISDKQITLAMEEKLAVNMARHWPEPKDGEPRLHIKEQPAPVVQDEDPRDAFERTFKMPKHVTRCGTGYAVTAYSAWLAHDFVRMWEGWNACRDVMLQGGNSPVIQDGWQLVPKEPTEAMNKAGWAAMNEHDAINPTYRAMLAAAPQQDVK